MEQKLAFFYEAAGRLRPENIMNLIPATFPMENVLDRDLFPGVGVFDVDRAMRERHPYFSNVSWITLCRKIVAGDMDNVGSIFDLCNTLAPPEVDGAEV